MTLLPGRWDGLVVICAGTFYNGHRLADQHLAERIAESGVPVLYVDPPLTPWGARRDAVRAAAASGPRLRLAAPGLARLTPKVPPGKTRGPVSALTDRLVRHQVAAAARELTTDVRAVLTVGGRNVLGACGERYKVFWARDDFAAGARLMGLPSARVAANEARTAREADLVVAVSPALEARWRAAGCATALVPNGCDARALESVGSVPPAQDVHLDEPVVGLVGTVGARIDFGLLEALACRGFSLLLVGQRQKNFHDDRLPLLLSRPNVQWVGHRDYASLPSYLTRMDVGLVPYADSPFNRASFPLKTLEYLAAGLPVVSTPLAATSWLATDLVRVASGAEEFCAEVATAIAERRAHAAVTRRREFAARHDWGERAKEVIALLP